MTTHDIVQQMIAECEGSARGLRFNASTTSVRERGEDFANTHLRDAEKQDERANALRALVTRCEELEHQQRDVANVIAFAHELGWNGTENSKFLSVFLRDAWNTRAPAPAREIAVKAFDQWVIGWLDAAVHENAAGKFARTYDRLASATAPERAVSDAQCDAIREVVLDMYETGIREDWPEAEGIERNRAAIRAAITGEVGG